MNKKPLYVSVFIGLVIITSVFYWWYQNKQPVQAIPPVVETDSSDVDIKEVKDIKAVDDLNDIVFSVSKNQFYVSSFDESKIYIINGGQFSIESEISVDFPHKLLLSSSEKELYVTLAGGFVSSISLDTLNMREKIKVGTKPSEMAIDTINQYLYVVNEFSDTVSIVDLESFQVVTTLEVGKRPNDIVLDQSNRLAYVSNERDGTVSVISADSLKVTGTIKDTGRPSSITLTPDNQYLLVLDRFNDQLIFVSPAATAVVNRIDVVGYPTNMDIDESQSKLYIASFTENSVGVVDLATQRLTGVIRLGSSFEKSEGLNNVSVNSLQGELIVTNTNTGQIFSIKLR